MQLIKITHIKCGEYSGQEFALVPDEWDAAQIKKLVTETTTELIADAKELKDHHPPTQPYSHKPRYEDFPDKTVREIQKEHNERLVEMREWQKHHWDLQRSFMTRLAEKGFVPLWAEEANLLTVSTDWGHNHGLNLNYEHADFGDNDLIGV